jgi:pimeloyl-ACP methyl ester carboxylesterase
LTTRIKQLRRAIGDSGREQRVVQTVHGRGYRFVAAVDEQPDPTERPKLGVPEELRQHIRFCTTPDGTRIGYATVGTGPPLVRAAHWITHLDYDWHSPVWRHWLVDLARARTLVRYDERGCGLSDHDVDDYSLDAWVQDLETVVDDLGLEHFALLGVSQGGAVAIAYAARHPERVTHLVLYGAYTLGRFRRATSEEQLREAALHLEMIRLGWGREDPRFRRFFTSSFIPDAPAELWDSFAELRGPEAGSVGAARRHRRGHHGAGADAGAPRAWRPARPVRAGPAAGHAHPGRQVRPPRQSQPSPPGGRARLGRVPARARRVRRLTGDRVWNTPSRGTSAAA